MQFDELFMKKEAISLLKKIASCPICEPFTDSEQEALYHLDNLGLIQFSAKTVSGRPGYEIRTSGLAYLMYNDDRKKQRTISARHYWITTVISILAFIEATISLILHFIQPA